MNIHFFVLPVLVAGTLLAVPQAHAASQIENKQPKQAQTQTKNETPKESAKEQKKHTVAVGENLSLIAQANNLESWRPLWDANAELSDPDVIQVGQVLVVPEGVTTPRELPAEPVAVAPPAAPAPQPVQYQSRPSYTPAPAAAATGDVWAKLRQCESGGNYANKRNPKYRGAYQFDYGTWGGYGGYNDPADAPPEVQDAKARDTQARRGWSPWPACSSKLGLR
ncbi:MAG TPA: transglycosylase family protein [Candidatus Dormibacteraeota bacterium]|nr:transglycosylase family protein [Candidatus Dormibacteraeota bacterium]